MLKKIIRISLISISILIGIIPFFIIKPVSIFPYNTNQNGYSNSDSLYGGNSTNKILEHSYLKISYRSKIMDRYRFPFSGYSLSFKENEMSFKYRNRLIYNISASESSVLRLNLGIKMEGMGNFIYETNIDVNNEGQTIIPIDNFKPANWWYTSNNINVDTFKDPELKNIVLFSIVTSSETPMNVEEVVTIKEVKALLDPKPYLITSLVFFALFIIFEIIMFKSRISKSFKYKEINVDSDEDIEEVSIIRFIGENYNLIDISIDMIADKTGVSKYKIPEILKNRYSKTFPQYLNSIRILEVKRLLVETDMSALDISLSVGYNSVSHFNRTFKNIEGLTPLNYRKQHKKPTI